MEALQIGYGAKICSKKGGQGIYKEVSMKKRNNRLCVAADGLAVWLRYSWQSG
ncbi:hypothetical protein STRDD11_01189 [Streptococcus sp. DD11]|nr:hypothetical protein STRDD11_01189 [Streptococcus sp. DD11]